MSRAFVKDDDQAFEELPERAISSPPNWVTDEGLAQIDAEIVKLNDQLAAAGDDRYERARVARDLRYWTSRRGSAQRTSKPTSNARVQFGSTVTLDREDGRREMFRIVGEDEADPSKGTISYMSPLARALMGKGAGDTVRVNGAEIEIVAVA